MKQQIESSPVIIYSKSTCPFCVKAKEVLTKGLNDVSTQVSSEGILFIEEIDYENDRGLALQTGLFAITQQRTVPNIFIGGKHIGGHD